MLNDVRKLKRREFVQASFALTSMLGPVGAVRADGLLRVAYNANGWPISRQSASGEVEGLLVDAVVQLAQRADFGVSHKALPWARAQAMVKEGELDAFCTTVTAERMIYAIFAPTPLLVLRNGVFHRKDDPRPALLRSVESMRPLRQGSYLGNGYVKRYLEADRIINATDKLTVLRQIAQGQLDVFVESEFTAALLRERPELLEKLQFTPLSFLPAIDYSFGIRRSYPEAQRMVDRVEAAIKSLRRSGAQATLLASWRRR